MKQYKNLDEITQDMYGMLSFFKNTTGFNREANLIEKAMHSLNIKADKKMNRYLVELGHAQKQEPNEETAYFKFIEDQAEMRRIREGPEPPDQMEEDYPPEDEEPEEKEPCDSCKAECENGFPCHQYAGYQP